MIETAVASVLAADADVAALVVDRIYALILPQRPTLPAITYQRVSSIRDANLREPLGVVGVRLQIDSWAPTYVGVKDLADKVRMALDGFSGDVGTDKIQGAFLVGDFDQFEADVKPTALWRVIQDFRIWHREASAA